MELVFVHPNRPPRILVVALLPLKPFLFVSSKKRPALPKPPNFCRSLRKNLEYAQLTALEAKPGERLMTFRFKTFEGAFALVYEGIPKYPNLILIGPDNNIVSALRYKNEVERPVMPQVPYHPPPQPGEKPNLWDLGGGEIQALWIKAGRPPLATWFKTGFRGTDPELNAYLAGFGEQDFLKWDELKVAALEKDWDRFILVQGPPPALKLLGNPSPEKESTAYGSVNQALEALYDLEIHHRVRLRQREKLESAITRALKHEKRILEKLKKDRSEAEKADQYQWWGELIMAHLHKVKSHVREAVLEDLVRGGPDPVAVPLDPDKTPLQNAQRYFKKSQKGSRGLELVRKREVEILERLNQLKSAQRSLPALQDPGEIQKAYRDLFPERKAASEKPPKPKAEKVATPNLIRRKLGKGVELCAGTSAAANDYVTFQLAQPEDLWFHVRDFPGSHVILRRLQRNAEVSGEMILEAAKLAATRSKAPSGSKVTVSYTEKKNVRKIPGAPLGMVTLTKEKSILVEA